MSPWEACHSIPNTSKLAAARVGEFFNGNPLNLMGLVFMNMDQLRFAFKSMNMDVGDEEHLMGKDTMVPLGGHHSGVKMRLFRVKWKKETFQMVVSICEQPGNIPMVTIICIPNWYQANKKDDSKTEDYYPYAIS